MNRWLAFTLLGVLVIAGCGPTQLPPPRTVVSTMEVKPGAVQTAARFSATVRPRHTVELSFKVPGTVESLYRVTANGGIRDVQEGDCLNQGIVIAQLETRDYRLSVATAQAALEQCRAGVSQAEASLGLAEAQQKAREEDFAFAKLDAERNASLNLDAITQRAKDLSATQRDVAAANLKAAAQQVIAAQQALLAARQQERATQVGLDTAQDRLGDCFLKVPFNDAIVVAKKVEAGERVAAYQSVFTLIDVEKVHVEFRVPDILLGDEAHHTFSPKVSAGDELDVFVEALGWEKFKGLVTKIAPAADPATRTFLIEITLDNPRDATHPLGRLRTGMIVSIRVGSERQATLLPLSAIQSSSQAGENCVYVLDGDVVRQRRIVLGGVFNNSVEILSGSELKTGERIVVGGANRVSDNALVRVLE